MEGLELLVDLHRDGWRQGPGSAAATRLALQLCGLRGATNPRVADIGCGTGAATLVLAEDLESEVIAVDLLPDFLLQLRRRARQRGLAGRIQTLAASMDALPFAEQSLDGIWSEGAIYSMGFGAGVQDWRRFLQPGGILAVTELTWFSSEPPAELERHWLEEYPEVATAAAKLAILEDQGYAPIAYFALPPRCWLENYYGPLQARFPAFLARHNNSDAAVAMVAAQEREIALYTRYAEHFGYGFYLARRR